MKRWKNENERGSSEGLVNDDIRGWDLKMGNKKITDLFINESLFIFLLKLL